MENLITLKEKEYVSEYLESLIEQLGKKIINNTFEKYLKKFNPEYTIKDYTMSSEYVARIKGTIKDDYNNSNDLDVEITLVLNGSSILIYKEIKDGTGDKGIFEAPEESEHEIEEISVNIANFINWRLTLS